MAREAKPCPFYGMPCEYVPMAEKVDAAAARIEQLEAEVKKFALDALIAADGNLMLHEENQRLRAALGWIMGTALTEPEAMVEKARAALGEKP